MVIISLACICAQCVLYNKNMSHEWVGLAIVNSYYETTSPELEWWLIKTQKGSTSHKVKKQQSTSLRNFLKFTRSTKPLPKIV